MSGLSALGEPLQSVVNYIIPCSYIYQQKLHGLCSGLKIINTTDLLAAVLSNLNAPRIFFKFPILCYKVYMYING